MTRGLVVSDLHIYSRQSRAAAFERTLRDVASRTDFVVLNGDTFEFRWTSLPSITATTCAAVAWVERISAAAPRCHFHFVQGNHDAIEALDEAMARLAGRVENVSWHRRYVRIGSHLFLHGDVANRRTDVPALERSRSRWARDRKRSPFLERCRSLSGPLGLERAFLKLYYPRRVVFSRLLHYVDRLEPAARDDVTDVWFGHTHRALANAEYRGIRFHNTGSALRGCRFSPLALWIDPDTAEQSTDANGPAHSSGDGSGDRNRHDSPFAPRTSDRPNEWGLDG